jgi:NAD+ kinase
MQLPSNVVFLPEMGLPKNTDFVCSIGGDGTILDAVSFSAEQGIPVAGVHTGRLGFLATISFGGLEDLVRRIKAGDYTLEERSLVQLIDNRNLFDGRNYALNEIAVMKRDTGSMITVHTFLNGKYLTSYWADGLIISTPTGSTGYSLSCGGPIVLPHSDSFILTPVSPHNLNVRPLVIPDSSVITCTVEGRGKKALLSLDTRSRVIDMDTSFSVRKEKFPAKLLRLPQDDFTDTLRNKLYWGADLRN